MNSPVDLPETVAYVVRHTISWNILNPAPDQYDWSELDAALGQAESEGKQLSFRVYSMIGEQFGGQRVPDWVLAEGAVIRPSGEPDYSNCTYQQRWGEFVKAMSDKYDGNSNIAFIDISGYGNFNEWSWQEQTRWDATWQAAVEIGTPDARAFRTLDGQARRRLADAFIGGAMHGHECRDNRGQTQVVDYAYAGFRKTQLVMPFAGIRQSTQYVRWRRPDVGFRFDSLGWSEQDQLVMDAAAGVWRTAPVVFELASPDQFTLASAQEVLQQTHGSLVHDNAYDQDPQAIQQLLLDAGYRYILRTATVSEVAPAGGNLGFSMAWQNVGSAPSYPGMGQDFRLHVLLVDGSSQRVQLDETLETNIAAWMPAASPLANPPDNQVVGALHIPREMQAGSYELQVAIIDPRTGRPIQLGFEGGNAEGHYLIGKVTITP